ncbi:UNVERIFIED_CONTAM: hypothetical protein ABIC26_003257 [Paenibacillus sp. PvR008]
MFFKKNETHSLAPIVEESRKLSQRIQQKDYSAAIQLSSASSEVEEIANNVNNTFTWTDEFRSMLGYQNEKDFPNVLDSWSSRLYPEGHDRSLEALSDHLLDYTGKTPYDVQYRLKLKHGEYR